ncbi:hypothetical protein UFOVP821_41 [uncultured Caudovirales phage]|uniref:Uncharacterized protein n=1 Tax=uncultured Caudovirales phage TaxID=2100421 RepID=A0A6J5P8D2_9CAUD|nr:hypothetical protein UFOVP821_41 [uncultured Caudovirales phage]
MESPAYWKSFAGGEISPDMYGRMDLAAYQSGLSLCKNFITMPHGPAMNRMGTRLAGYARMSPSSSYAADQLDTPIRLIPFVVSSTETYVVEMGKTNTSPKNLYLRFFRNGRPVTVATMVTTHDGAGMSTFTGTITAGNNPVVTFTTPAAHGFSNGDWVMFRGTSSDLDDRTFVVLSSTTSTITLTTPLGGNCPLSGTYASGTNGVSGKVGRVLTLTSAIDLTSINISDIRYAQSALVMTLTHPDMPVQELTWASSPGLYTGTPFTLTAPTFNPSIPAPVASGVSLSGATTITQGRNYAYCITAISDRANEESYASNVVSITNNLDQLDHRNFISWVAASGAVRYRIYKDDNDSGIFGYIGEAGKTANASGTTPAGAFSVFADYRFFIPTGTWNTGLTFLDDNITPDYSISPPQVTTPFVTTNAYPTACAYFQQRRVFGGTYEKPQNIWLTRTGAESNFTSSLPLRDDDAISVRLASREANGIRHIVALNDLLLFTQSAVWKMGSVDTDAITPRSVLIKPQDFVGASSVRPLAFASSVLYAVSRGGRMAEISFDWASSAYRAQDLSLAAPHLFDAWRIVDLAHTTDPASIAWAVRSDGTLLGCTFMPDEKVRAWHQHYTYNPDGTQAKFESVAVVTEVDELTGFAVDNTYFVVKRTINGQTVRLVEMMGRRRLLQAVQGYAPPSSAVMYYQPSGVDAVAMNDSGVTKYSQLTTSKISTVGGLWHLEGAVVTVLADGVAQANQTVSGGKITLPTPANLVHIGLPYVCDLQTLPLGLDVAGGGQTFLKNINRVWVRLVDSLTFYAGPTFNNLRPWNATQVTGASTVTTAASLSPAPFPSVGGLLDRTSWDVGTGNRSAQSTMVELRIDPSWNHDAPLCVRHNSPTPLEIAGMAVEVSLGD